MRRSPECRQLLSVKSMMRYRPPKGTAGLALSAVNGCRREPIPPARMMLIVFSSMESLRCSFEQKSRIRIEPRIAARTSKFRLLQTHDCD